MPAARSHVEHCHRPETPFWLICSYDAVTLSPAVVEEAHRSHPVIVDAGSYQRSAHYTGRAHVDEMFAAELSEPVGRPIQPPAACRVSDTIKSLRWRHDCQQLADSDEAPRFPREGLPCRVCRPTTAPCAQALSSPRLHWCRASRTHGKQVTAP